MSYKITKRHHFDFWEKEWALKQIILSYTFYSKNLKMSIFCFYANV